MGCQRCKSLRLSRIQAKCNDSIVFDLPGKGSVVGEYPLELEDIAADDYVDFTFCLSCGQVQGTFPIELDKGKEKYCSECKCERFGIVLFNGRKMRACSDCGALTDDA